MKTQTGIAILFAQLTASPLFKMLLNGARKLCGYVHSPAQQARRYPDFKELMGSDAWYRLPLAVRRRFDGNSAALKEKIYAGEMLVVRASRLGRLLAEAGRIIGTPIVPLTGTNVPMFVRLYNVPHVAGIAWERIYRFESNPIITVRSIKMLSNAGTLVETLGFGLRMPLALFERDGDLFFESTGEYFQWGWLKIPLPRCLRPGETTIIHRDLGGGRFCFILQIEHPWFGEMFYQEGYFQDGE